MQLHFRSVNVSELIASLTDLYLLSAEEKGLALETSVPPDLIVTADAMRPLPDLISSDDATLALISGGHMGILAGSNTPTEAWPQLAEWLAPRSQ